MLTRDDLNRHATVLAILQHPGMDRRHPKRGIQSVDAICTAPNGTELCVKLGDVV
jgi:hypothetical protein